ncbi:MAG: TRAP transporter large permease subunit, partial [Desulfamplus sp.]|nr:TRAP transporter large permease subunit [Desulfamplus sp.]
GVLACALFAAVSGSSPATVVAIGSILLPAMVRQGYPMKFGVGVIGTSGGLGILIPPSIVMVIYAVSTNASIGKLFVAGIIPGILLGSLLMAVTWIVAKKRNYPRLPRASFKTVVRTFKESIWGLMLIVVVIGGIYSGMFTPTEAAAMSAVYAFVVAVFIYKDMTMKEVPRTLLAAANMSAMILYIITNAVLFSFLLTSEQIPQQLTDWITHMGLGSVGFLIMVNLLLLAAGNFMEPSSILLITAPLLYPMAMQLNIDPIHLGVLMTVNMEIGMITPPVGLNLYVASGISHLGLTETTKACAPWIIVMLIYLMFITYIPAISLWLPNLLFN